MELTGMHSDGGTCKALAIVSASHVLQPCRPSIRNESARRRANATSPLASRRRFSKYDTPPASNADVEDAERAADMMAPTLIP